MLNTILRSIEVFYLAVRLVSEFQAQDALI